LNRLGEPVFSISKCTWPGCFACTGQVPSFLRFGMTRAGAANFVPTSTGAAIATTKALPQNKDLFDGIAVRGPVTVGSLADIVLITQRPTTVEEVNQIFIEETASDRYHGIVRITEDPIVSSDIIKDPHASIVDLGMTRVVDGDLVKILSWYDNEWGFTNQMVREALRIEQMT
jgi:glyceraldehyde 3-phosphate dehydrogenase